ncbi:hypothetical protein ACHAPI_006578 [Fusarium lateritium]
MARPLLTRADSTLFVHEDVYVAYNNLGSQTIRNGESTVNHEYQQQGNHDFGFTFSYRYNANGYDESQDRYNYNMNVRYVILAEFDTEMMQDALAILLFPEIDSSGQINIKHWEDEVPNLINAWARKRIPDPTHRPGESSQKLIQKIYELHQRMLMYIQDYITKATSDFLQRAYSWVPTLAQDGTFIISHPLEGVFDLRKLGESGRKRLFWAFLRYELMSKIRLYKSVVNRFYIPPLELERRKGKLFRTWETEALHCVRTYSSYLYRAFFAQLSGPGLPNAGTSHVPLPAESGMPTQMVQLALGWAFEGDREVEDWLRIMTKLPNFGFGLITNLIFYTNARQVSGRVRAFANNIKPLCCDEVHKGLSRSFSNRREDDEEIPGLFSEIVELYGSYENSIPVAQAEMYRQRAWPFFNHARVHPQYYALVPRVNGHLNFRPGQAIADFIRWRTQARINRML